MADNSKLIIASIKAGKEVKLSQRDFLTVSEYCKNAGIQIEVLNKNGMDLTIKQIEWSSPK